MRKLSYQEKVQRNIMKDIRLHRIPSRNREDKKPIPVFHTCGICKKNPVKNHHYLCDKCWKEKQMINKTERRLKK